MKKTVSKHLLSLLYFSLLAAITHAQTSHHSRSSQHTKLFKNAMYTAEQENFKGAIEIFKKITKEDPNDLDALYNMGLSYLNTSHGADSAIICFNKGLSLLSDEEKKAYVGNVIRLSLGKAYQILLQPIKAISIYEELLNNTESQNTTLIEEIKREIQICRHANLLISNPINLTIKNMGSRVNSKYNDHSPLISVSENQLFFTSRRNWLRLSLLSDGQYAEKVYTVPLGNNNYESARMLKVFFNPNEHEAASSISPDGNQLILFRNDEQGTSLYFSNYNGEIWSTPEKFPYPINSNAKETHGCISADRSTFFFTSDRKGGYGGLDIYMIKKLPNGKWGNAQNLGPHINTQYDEVTPMIHYDGKTLYFSSEGHNTMGRLDIFYSAMTPDSTWSIPVNMGYPINSPDDDFFFVPTISKSHAYYASSKFTDNYGGSDIYHVEIEADSNTELAVIEGEVDNSLGDHFSKIRILVTRTDNQQIVGDYRPEPNNGKYLMFLENGHEYQVKQLNTANKEKTSYINVTRNMNYLRTQTTIKFADVAMDAPLVKTIKTVLDNVRHSIEQELKKEQDQEPIGNKTDDDSSSLHKAIPSNITSDEQALIVTKPQERIQVTPKQNKHYTLQLLALKKSPLPDLQFFSSRNIENVTVHDCNDDYTRYTYGEFTSYQACLKIKDELLKNNHIDDIWIRSVDDFVHLAKN